MALMLPLSSSTASADAIVITSGGGSVYADGDLGGFQLTGDGTQIGFDHHGSGTTGFHSGQTVSIHDIIGPYTTFSRTATVSGTVYPSVFLFGSLDLRGSPFVAATAPMNTNMIFSTSFTMNGYLIGCSSNSATWNGTVYTCGSSRTLFSQSLTGSGFATTSARAIDDPSGRTLWLSRGADNFTFSPASPSPTPEPATVLLVGMGLAAGARRLRGSPHTMLRSTTPKPNPPESS
jgi:hypothetical protein